MEKTKVKEGVHVTDRWYPEFGTGVIKNVKKTVFTIDFPNKGEMKYDYAHAQFLEVVNPIKTN